MKRCVSAQDGMRREIGKVWIANALKQAAIAGPIGP